MWFVICKPLDRTVIPPFRLFRVLAARFHVQIVIRGPLLHIKSTRMLKNKAKNWFASSKCYLFFTTAEHWDNTKANRVDWESRRPVLREDAQANVSVAVDVRVDRDFRTNKNHLKKHEKSSCYTAIPSLPYQIQYLGRIEGVLWAETELQLELFSIIDCPCSTIQAHNPSYENEEKEGINMLDNLLAGHVMLTHQADARQTLHLSQHLVVGLWWGTPVPFEAVSASTKNSEHQYIDY